MFCGFISNIKLFKRKNLVDLISSKKSINSIRLFCNKNKIADSNLIIELVELMYNSDAVTDNIINWDLSFSEACANGQINLCKKILELNGKFSISTNYNKYLTDACVGNSIEIVKWLGNTNASIENSDELFQIACANENLPLVQWLLESNPNIEISANDNRAFISACSRGNLALAQLLYNLNINLNEIDIENILVEICIGEHKNVIIWLSSIPLTIPINWEYVFCCICFAGVTDMAKWLYKFKPKTNIKAYDNFAFKNACAHSNLELIEWLYQTNPNVINSIGNLFNELCGKNNIQVAQFLAMNNPDKYYLELFNGKIKNFKTKITQKIVIGNIFRQREPCTICYKTKSNILTKCKHFYCEECICKWIRINSTCPYCRCFLSYDDLFNILY